MTELSGDCDSSDFDGNTFLVGSDDNEFIFIAVFQIMKLNTEDEIIDFISRMGNIMISTALAGREKHTYFISDHYKLLEKNNIEEETFLNCILYDSIIPYEDQVLKCSGEGFKTIKCNQFHSFHRNEDGEEDNEEEYMWRAQRQLDNWSEEQRNCLKPAYCNGNKETVKISNEECAMCFENHSVYAFCQCGHQRICENCWTNSKAEMLKCADGRTHMFQKISILRNQHHAFRPGHTRHVHDVICQLRWHILLLPILFRINNRIDLLLFPFLLF